MITSVGGCCYCYAVPSPTSISITNTTPWTVKAYRNLATMCRRARQRYRATPSITALTYCHQREQGSAGSSHRWQHSVSTAATNASETARRSRRRQRSVSTAATSASESLHAGGNTQSVLLPLVRARVCTQVATLSQYFCH